MKRAINSNKRKEELERLYQPQSPTVFKLKTAKATPAKTIQIKPLTWTELLFSLLLTFFLIGIQLFISRLIL